MGDRLHRREPGVPDALSAANSARVLDSTTNTAPYLRTDCGCGRAVQSKEAGDHGWPFMTRRVPIGSDRQHTVAFELSKDQQTRQVTDQASTSDRLCGSQFPRQIRIRWRRGMGIDARPGVPTPGRQVRRVLPRDRRHDGPRGGRGRARPAHLIGGREALTSWPVNAPTTQLPAPPCTYRGSDLVHNLDEFQEGMSTKQARPPIAAISVPHPHRHRHGHMQRQLAFRDDIELNGLDRFQRSQIVRHPPLPDLQGNTPRKAHRPR